ncbi:unnamed protein product [Prorocentrum cordatum]|uniref:Uncharacterized protein n=1 Tax=Prorocentrum cordatum TaxID=2364126 RepID=A0ABN9WUZ5_9DINO|nr:unnamed protein product [Polarella glacialis]
MDGVGLQLCLPHLAEQRKNLPPKPNFLAGAHGSVVADEAGLQFRLPHLAEQQQSLVPPPAFLTCADPGAVAEVTSGSKFACQTSASNTKACCQCPHFSHALMTAL